MIDCVCSFFNRSNSSYFPRETSFRSQISVLQQKKASLVASLDNISRQRQSLTTVVKEHMRAGCKFRTGWWCDFDWHTTCERICSWIWSLPSALGRHLDFNFLVSLRSTFLFHFFFIVVCFVSHLVTPYPFPPLCTYFSLLLRLHRWSLDWTHFHNTRALVCVFLLLSHILVFHLKSSSFLYHPLKKRTSTIYVDP